MRSLDAMCATEAQFGDGGKRRALHGHGTVRCSPPCRHDAVGAVRITHRWGAQQMAGGPMEARGVPKENGRQWANQPGTGGGDEGMAVEVWQWVGPPNPKKLSKTAATLVITYVSCLGGWTCRNAGCRALWRVARARESSSTNSALATGGARKNYSDAMAIRSVHAATKPSQGG